MNHIDTSKIYFFIKKYQKTHKLSSEEKEYISSHTTRFIKSLEWINTVISEKSNILEIGYSGFFTFLLSQYFPKANIDNTDWDLGYPWPKLKERYDLIINMEVIEHIQDQKRPIQDSVNFSGVNCFLSECRKVLKKNGIIFSTTPNICSYQSIQKLLIQTSPLVWQYHFREYSKQELIDLFENNKFVIRKIQSINVWEQPSGKIINLIILIEKIRSYTVRGYFRERGDDFFILASRS